MILTCPNCSTRYQTDAEKFPPEGRNVRCAKCGFVWRHTPESEPADDDDISFTDTTGAAAAAATEAAEPAAPATEQTEPLAAHRQRGDRPASAETETPSIWERLLVGVGWTGLVAVVLLIGWAAIAYRQVVLTSWPQSATVYTKLGFQPETAVLHLTADPYTRTVENGEPVLVVSGQLRNDGAQDIAVPLLIATLSDSARRELYHWSFRASDARLRPGQSTRFVTRLSSPPAEARHLDLHLARNGE